jgi:hypothetical protein
VGSSNADKNPGLKPLTSSSFVNATLSVLTKRSHSLNLQIHPRIASMAES